MAPFPELGQSKPCPCACPLPHPTTFWVALTHVVGAWGPVRMWSLVHWRIMGLHPRRGAIGVVLHRVTAMPPHVRHGVREVVRATRPCRPATPTAATSTPTTATSTTTAMHAVEGPVLRRARIHPWWTVLREERDACQEFLHTRQNQPWATHPWH